MQSLTIAERAALNALYESAEFRPPEHIAKRLLSDALIEPHRDRFRLTVAGRRALAPRVFGTAMRA